MKARNTSLLAVLVAALFAVFGVSAARAEDKPSVIRIAYPGVGIGNRPFVGGNSTALLHLKGLLEEEFKKDGIEVRWTFLRGAGPAVNELYANGLADFSLLGDLPSIVGHAGGLKTKVLAATGIRGNTYLAVQADSNIQSIKDLVGKRVAVFKGTNIQLAVAKLLEANGLNEKDIRFYNMDTATSRAALTTKDVDAVFGGNDLLSLRDQGVARIVYRTLGDPKFLRHASFIGTEEFINKYPSVTQRVVNTLVTAAKYISDAETNPTPLFQLYQKSGVRFQDFKEDLQGQNLKVNASPLLDEYFVAQYKIQVDQSKKYGLIRNTFSVDQWLEPKFLKQALKNQGLENFWAPVDAQGKSRPVEAPKAAAAPQAAPQAEPAIKSAQL
jgi:sulfonate transport system substrate-binding protein